MKGIEFEKKLNDKYAHLGLDDVADFEALFFESIKKEENLKTGEVVKGHVVKITKDSVVVDIGYKSEGSIPVEEFYDAKRNLIVDIGDSVDVFLENVEDDHGNLILSKDKADKMKIWDEIAVAFENDRLIEGRVVEKVKGGLSVDIGVKAFLPGSQIDLTPVRNLDGLLDNVYKFKIIKFNKKRGNIVLSRRALLEKERENLRKETMKVLEEGAILRGIVKNITEYGAFIDLGGIDGLLHITDISWGRVNHPSEVFSIGDEVKVKVLRYDRNTERVSLGLKQTTPDPWVDASKKYKVGDKVKGRVVSITDYGAFLELEEGVEGLIHISEMSWIKRVKHPSKMVALGDQVEVMVLDIDAEKRRISLGMKQLEPNPWEQIAKKYPIGSLVSGKIRNMTEFGVFIGLEDGVDGLVHISDISWTRKIKHPSETFKKGDDIEAKVLNIDIENERFGLGIKQMHKDPWIEVTEQWKAGMTFEGMVLRTTDTEVQVLMENDIEGYVKREELDDAAVQALYPELKDGDKIKATAKKIDDKDRRIILSFKKLDDATEKAEENA